MTAPLPATPLAAAAARPDRVLAVASGKGGVGKTWFAVTLAHALAFAGEKLVLFDGDVGLANVDIQLGLLPDRDLAGFVSGRIPLAEAVTPVDGGAARAGAGGGFDVLAGRSGSGALADLAGAELHRLREGLVGLTGAYDRVVVDLAAGLGRDVKALCTLGGPVAVVVTAEPTSLTDAYATIKVLSRLAPGLDLRVVVNQVDSRADGLRIHESLRRACGHFLELAPPLLGVIRRDAKVREAIRHQVPLLRRYPQSQAAADVLAIGRALHGG